MIIAGIDEAGYGPLLGPLVVSGVAFEVPDALADQSLWDLLAASVCPVPKKRDLRLPIADSKKLFQRSAGLATLERTALCMLHAADRRPKTLHNLLDVVAPGLVTELARYPWYDGYNPNLPRATTAVDITTRANAVQRDLAARGIQLRGVYSAVLPEGHFNELVAQTNNKATVLMRLVLRLVHRIAQRFGDHVRIYVDRQGGREHYVEKLMTFFQHAELRVVEESPTRSAYALAMDGRELTVEFLTEGESRQLPIALGSIYSKYLRELLMEALNAYFSRRVEALTPTAGYYTDAKRFLRDIEPAVQQAGLDRAMLVRSR